MLMELTLDRNSNLQQKLKRTGNGKDVYKYKIL